MGWLGCFQSVTQLEIFGYFIFQGVVTLGRGFVVTECRGHYHPTPPPLSKVYPGAQKAPPQRGLTMGVSEGTEGWGYVEVWDYLRTINRTS